MPNMRTSSLGVKEGCKAACLNKEALTGYGQNWAGFDLHGFTVNERTGECYCNGDPQPEDCVKRDNNYFQTRKRTRWFQAL